MQSIIVTDQPKHWDFATQYIKVISTETYLMDATFFEEKSLRIINLNSSYRYQSEGYYVSLLAKARNHKIVPSTTTIQDLSNKSLAKTISYEIDDDIQRILKPLKSNDFTLSIYFGHNVAKRYDKLSQQLHKLFPAPLFRVVFHKQKNWQIKSIFSISIGDVPEVHQSYFKQFALEYFQKKRFHTAKLPRHLYDMAILVDEDEPCPPSDKRALKKFIHAAEESGFDVELINKDDYRSIADYDALFIRVTTSVNHYTYRFARRAMAEGIVVIDDPDSILKCSNKVYLTELLSRAKIHTPKTLILNKTRRIELIKGLHYPCVLKLPDSSFSQGVSKVNNEQELKKALDKCFHQSDLVLLQEYMPTDYDWRIGIIDKQALFACRYFMAKDHWQIYNWDNKKSVTGLWETLDIDQVPANVLKTALRAANLIGDGFYGVDLKQIKDEVYVIEINDNPSIDRGVEDGVLGERLYLNIMQSFLKRLKKRTQHE